MRFVVLDADTGAVVMNSHREVKRVNGKRVASPEYRSWQMMKNRCLNPKARDYAYYGERGITVDSSWMIFENFLIDMGRKPDLAMTLDRIDNELGYVKWNCRWATRKEQSRNRSYYHTCSLARAEEIRKLYASGNYYQYEIAEIFGITQAHVSQIVRNVCWARD